MSDFQKNIELSEGQRKIFDLMENTKRNLFVTGKAGTGKSFLLKYFKEHTKKSVLYTAPTGIAAINIGGVTIHSIFGFDNVQDGVNYFKIPSDKREILQCIDVLVIDEISMARVDTFEQVDKILKFVNRSKLPFGGKQVIVFGDVLQLPPVVKEKAELECFYAKYGNIFFFNSNAYKEGNFESYELSTIFRQKDGLFIDILNDVRIGKLTPESADVLNRHCISNYPKNVTQLVPLNALANNINEERLREINAKEYTYSAIIKTDKKIREEDYRCAFNLKLKVGAHIMMITNDNDLGRWVNGSVGVVSALSDDHIKVIINGKEHTVERYDFVKNKCIYDREKKKLIYIPESHVIQYPLILSYAITIHKSQGMTYSEVVCDLEKCFECGQVYVALSRCSNFEKLYLVTKLAADVVLVNRTVMEFYNSQMRQIA